MTVGVYHTASLGDNVATYDHADFDVTASGSLDLRAFVNMPWASNRDGAFISNLDTGTRGGWEFRRGGAADKYLVFVVYIGVTGTVTTSTSAFPFNDGEDGSVRMLWEGPGSGTTTFYYRTDGDIASDTGWTSLGAIAGPVDTWAKASPASPCFGSRGADVSTAVKWIGINYHCRIAVDGTLVAEWKAENTGTRSTDSTGKVWNVNGSTWATTIT
jgi:hypothetical protein